MPHRHAVSMPAQATTRGFSLPELLAALTVAGLLYALGAPPLSEWSARQRVRASTADLRADFQAARARAARLSAPVVVCPAIGDQCARTPDFTQGWIAWVNRDGDSPPVRDSDEPVLLRGQPATSVRLRANRSRFILNGPAIRSTNGTIVACDQAGRTAPRAIVVSYSGRARSTTHFSGSCP